MSEFFIAGIGSRETPPEILEMMTAFASWVTSFPDVIIRSGHAAGADYAFERGAREQTEVYIPWRSYKSDGPLLTDRVIDMETVNPKLRMMAKESVKLMHPAPDRLTPGGELLHERNFLIVVGTEFQQEPQKVDQLPEVSIGLKPVAMSKAVVCWTPGGRMKGGTAQALRVAEGYWVPIYNLGHRKASDSRLRKWFETRWPARFKKR